MKESLSICLMRILGLPFTFPPIAYFWVYTIYHQTAVDWNVSLQKPKETCRR